MKASEEAVSSSPLLFPRWLNDGPWVLSRTFAGIFCPFHCVSDMVITHHHFCFFLRVRNEKEGEDVAPLANRSRGIGIGAPMAPMNNFLETRPLQCDVWLLPLRDGVSCPTP